MTEFCDIQKLAELFNSKKDESDSDDAEENLLEPIPSTSKGTLDNSVPRQSNSIKKKVNPYSKIEPQGNEEEELFELNENEEYVLKEDCHRSDWKKTPLWDISYKQQVTASDVFLQMGLKTPSTASCEDMIVTVHLPDEKLQNIDLKVLPNEVIVISPKFYLKLPLPQPVDPQIGNAHWDKNESKLMVTLRMKRELDIVNF